MAKKKDAFNVGVDADVRLNSKYGYCPYCTRYIGSGYIAIEHKKLCKNVSPKVREIHSGIKQKRYTA